MKILIFGGTRFLGRHIAELCLDRGHEVTLFNRGQTDPGLFSDRAELVRGDRDGGLDRLAGRSFEACIDPSGYVPRLVRDSCELLKDTVGHYTFISSISVYSSFEAGQDERAPLAELDDDTTEVVDDATYGGLKALCERAAEAAMPGRVLNVRSGLIVGPYDPTDRFSYWPLRVARGGDYLAPVGPDFPIQVIDARDQAAWILDCVAREVTGTFNVTGRETTLGAVLLAAGEVTRSAPKPVWLPEQFLLDNGVTPWTDLPMWLHESAKGMLQVSVAAAEAEGLTTRPLQDSIRDILAWHHGDLERLAAGLEPEREHMLIEKYRSI